ncbi:hypothetical protein WMY93_032038 [Mugilogobius chulae]|uniref:Uncharacterized protein n=1 Tax=Mugilogobius chulae TaxID=88201 RepID=A0AAW0MCM2_9GOBI
MMLLTNSPNRITVTHRHKERKHNTSLNLATPPELVEDDLESNGGIAKKLASIKEDEEGSSSEGSPRMPLAGWLTVCAPPLRSPLLPPRPFRPSSEPSLRPATLQIPVVSFSCPQPQSPRFDFSPSTSHSFPPSPDTSSPVDPESADTMRTISKLKHEDERSVSSGDQREPGATGSDTPPQAPPPQPFCGFNSAHHQHNSAPEPPSSHSVSPAPFFLSPHAATDSAEGQTSNLHDRNLTHDFLVSPTRKLTHSSAPTSLTSSPNERNAQKLNSSSNPALSTTLLIDLDATDTQALSWSS